MAKTIQPAHDLPSISTEEHTLIIDGEFEEIPNDTNETDDDASLIDFNSAEDENSEPELSPIEYAATVNSISENETVNEPETANPEVVEELTAVMLDPNDDVPDIEFMIEYLTSHELDEHKARKFVSYLRTIDDKQRLALWESFKGTYGSNINTITAAAKVETLIKAVDQSQSLKLRNSAVQAEMSRAASVFSSLQRYLRSDIGDTPLNSFRFDNTSKALQESYRQLTVLNSAILSMAQMLMVGNVSEEEVADCVINVERAVKICAAVGYSAKGWQNVYEHAAKQAKQTQQEIDSLKSALRSANESAATAHAQLLAERRRIDTLTLSAECYVIGNHSGNFLTTVNKPDEDTLHYRVSPFNLRLTQERDEALELTDIEVAREVFDAVQTWSKKNRLVHDLFKRSGVNPETLFISATSLIKVS